MDFKLEIFIERLKNEETQIIQEEIPSYLLSLKDQEVSFSETVSLKGKTYLASDHLILELSVKAVAFLPCIICNEQTPFEIFLPSLHHAQELSEIPSGIFHYQELIRESLLLQLPAFLECHNNQCPEREVIKKFFKKEQFSKGFQDL
jgi:hypothetical protein